MNKMLDGIKLRRRKKRLLSGVSAVLCGVILLCVSFGLMHPAITMGQEPECGYLEHIHTDDCLKSLTLNSSLICAAEEHIHADLCYNAQGELICTLPEHAHAESCYREPETVSALVCQLPEHIHTESCYPETPEYTLAPQPHCGLAEHTHRPDCGENCTIPEHTHTEACYVIPEAENSEEETPVETPQEDIPKDEAVETESQEETEPGEISQENTQEDIPQEDDPSETSPETANGSTAAEALYARFAPEDADRERLDSLLERFGLSPEELLTLLEEAEMPIVDLDSLEIYLASFQEAEVLGEESTSNPEATMPMQFFLTLQNAVPTAEDTATHNAIKFTQHFSMTGTIKPITGYTSMENWPMNPPSADQWKAVVRANYPTLTEEQISHLEVVWVGAAPQSSVEKSNNAYKDCWDNHYGGHVDGYLKWEDGYEGPNLSAACGITLTAGMWWRDQVPDNATCVLLRKNADGDYVEYDRKTFSRDPHTGEYDHIWTGLPGVESDYAMRVDGLDTNLWKIKYHKDTSGYDENNDFSDELTYTKPIRFEGGNWGQYGYKMLAWAFWNGGDYGSLRLEKNTLLNGQSSPDATPEDTLFTVQNEDASYTHTIKYRDLLTDDRGNRYLVLDHLKPGNYTVTESGSEKPGHVLRVTGNTTAEVKTNETAVVTVANEYTTGAELPDTGGAGTFPLYLLGCALIALAGFGLLWRRRQA